MATGTLAEGASVMKGDVFDAVDGVSVRGLDIAHVRSKLLGQRRRHRAGARDARRQGERRVLDHARRGARADGLSEAAAQRDRVHRRRRVRRADRRRVRRGAQASAGAERARVRDRPAEQRRRVHQRRGGDRRALHPQRAHRVGRGTLGHDPVRRRRQRRRAAARRGARQPLLGFGLGDHGGRAAGRRRCDAGGRRTSAKAWCSSSRTTPTARR